MRRRKPLDPVELARRLRRWEEITVLGLALHGARRIEGRAHSFADCVLGGLKPANRARVERIG